MSNAQCTTCTSIHTLKFRWLGKMKKYTFLPDLNAKAKMYILAFNKVQLMRI